MEWLGMASQIIIALIPVIVIGAFKWMDHKFSQVREDFATHGEGLQCVLRDLLMEKMKEASQNNCADEHLREDVTDMYNSYVKLKGNGMIKGMYSEFVKLPFPKKK